MKHHPESLSIDQKREHIKAHFQYVLPESSLTSDEIVNAMYDLCLVQEQFKLAVETFRNPNNRHNIPQMKAHWQQHYQKAENILLRYNHVDFDSYLERMINAHRRKVVMLGTIINTQDARSCLSFFDRWIICANPIESLKQLLPEWLALPEPRTRIDIETGNAMFHLVEYFLFQANIQDPTFDSMRRLLGFFSDLNNPAKTPSALYEKLHTPPRVVLTKLLMSLLQDFSNRAVVDTIYQDNIGTFRGLLEEIIELRYKEESHPFLISLIQQIIEDDAGKIILPELIPDIAKPTHFLDPIISLVQLPYSVLNSAFGFTSRLFSTAVATFVGTPEEEESLELGRPPSPPA